MLGFDLIISSSGLCLCPSQLKNNVFERFFLILNLSRWTRVRAVADECFGSGVFVLVFVNFPWYARRMRNPNGGYESDSVLKLI